MNLNDIVHDFTRRYGDTYVLVQMPGESEKNVFYVNSIVPDDEQGAVLQLSSNEYGSIKLNMATGHNIFFEYPNVGTFQHGKEAIIFRRVPARQYRRGLCSGNAAFIQPANRLWAQRRVDWTWDVVNDAYNAKKYSLSDAMKMLKSGKYRSVALAGGWSLSLSPTANTNYLLFYFDLPVAWINPKDGAAVILETQFTKEVENLK